MKPDRCAWVAARLPLMADGELAGLERRRVERHVLGCPSCRERLAAQSRALGVLHSAAAEDPTSGHVSVWPALMRQIQETRRSTTPRFSRRVLALRVGLAAAAVLAAATTGWGLWSLHQRYQVVVRPRVPRSVAAAPVPSRVSLSPSPTSLVIPASEARETERATLAEDFSRGVDGRPGLAPTN